MFCDSVEIKIVLSSQNSDEKVIKILISATLWRQPSSTCLF